jgi:hypothetical protein
LFGSEGLSWGISSLQSTRGPEWIFTCVSVVRGRGFTISLVILGAYCLMDLGSEWRGGVLSQVGHTLLGVVRGSFLVVGVAVSFQSDCALDGIVTKTRMNV